jgi:hypothetical protein
MEENAREAKIKMNSMSRVCWKGMCCETSSEEIMLDSEVSGYLYYIPPPTIPQKDKVFQNHMQHVSIQCDADVQGLRILVWILVFFDEV